jgi:hypothetical protein
LFFVYHFSITGLQRKRIAPNQNIPGMRKAKNRMHTGDFFAPVKNLRFFQRFSMFFLAFYSRLGYSPPRPEFYVNKTGEFTRGLPRLRRGGNKKSGG